MKGEIIASTYDDKPESFKIGLQRLLACIEEALIGLKKGDKKEVTVPPEKGFGERRAGLLQEVPKSIFKEKPPKDTMIQLKYKDGSQRLSTVHEVKANSIVLDHNHPLAGQTLKFDVEIIDVEHSP
jgi:FKBP-type peptidyl-prolyl cis-trans isomerase 2